jgi:hypothetical protein
LSLMTRPVSGLGTARGAEHFGRLY